MKRNMLPSPVFVNPALLASPITPKAPRTDVISCCFNSPQYDKVGLKPLVEKLIERLDTHMVVDYDPSPAKKTRVAWFFVRLSTVRLTEKVNQVQWEKALLVADHVVLIATHHAHSFPSMSNPSTDATGKPWLKPKYFCQVLYYESSLVDNDREALNQNALNVLRSASA